MGVSVKAIELFTMQSQDDSPEQGQDERMSYACLEAWCAHLNRELEGQWKINAKHVKKIWELEKRVQELEEANKQLAKGGNA